MRGGDDELLARLLEPLLARLQVTLMRISMKPIVESLRARGFAHVATGSLDLATYRSVAAELGEVLGEEQIALRPGAHAYVAKPGKVPLHTDHPEVNLIGWLCEEQDDEDGASLLLDARPVVAALADEQRCRLRSVGLACPPLEGGPPKGTWPVLRATATGDAVFCSPWLRSASSRSEDVNVVEEFRQRISDEARRAAIEVRLGRGDALFVDNARVLHGRRAIAEGSRRRLQRVWLKDKTAA